MKSKVTDQTATGQVGIKKRSKVPGVMITQFVEEIPEGKSHPDFTRKPIALTIQEGKFAFFKAKVLGEPQPTVTWSRNKGDVSDTSRYVTKHDPVADEHIFEMANVSPDQADTYKCFATNEFGKAVVTVVLNVIAVGFNKNKAMQAVEGEDLKTVMKRRSKVRPKSEQPARKPGEVDEKFWELLLSADKKDYERIMSEYGVTDFRWMLKKLNEMKKEREEEQAQWVTSRSNLRPIEVNPDCTASFEIDMDLIEPSSRIFVYKDGVMVPYTKELGDKMKHSLTQVGRKFVFSIKDLLPDDAGLYQLDVEDVNMFSTDFKIPMVEFLVKIQEVKAMEREDAVFECVLTNPFSKIMWVGKNLTLEQGDKYDIEASEDKLIHRLIVKDCMIVDKGIYAAVAGIQSCNAWLIVEADKSAAQGKKKVRKATRAGGAGLDLEKIAQEQQVKLVQDREERKEQVKTAMEEKAAAPEPPPAPAVAPPVVEVEAPPPKPGLSDKEGPQVVEVVNETVDNDGTGLELGDSGSGQSNNDQSNQSNIDQSNNDQSNNDGAVVIPLGGNGVPQITTGLSDKYVIRTQPAELVVQMNCECDGAWFKDDEKLSSKDGLTLTKDGTSHKLAIRCSKDDDSGMYQFEADGCKTAANLTVGDVPEFDPDDLHKFSKPVIVKVGQNGTFKMPYTPQDSLEVKWFKDGVELKDGGGVKIMKETNHSRLTFRDCLRTDSGEITIQLKTPFGSVEAKSRLIVLDKPGPPEGPVEVVESTSSVIELKWNPPKDDGGSPVTHYVIERQQMGHNLWKKLGDITADKTTYRDRNVNHGKKYIYRIFAENSEGLSDALETENIMAGVLVFPGPPGAPTVVSASKTCITLTWTPPTETFGTVVIGYQLEKRKKDTNQWVALNPVNEPIEGETYAVKDVTEGSEYEFRVSAINESGAGDPSPPSVMVCAKNPDMKPRFKDPEDFMVIRAGNSLRIKISYEAEPPPTITWLKDNEPVSPWINVINTEGMSQLVIPSSKRSDSGIFTIKAKNSVGEASFDIEVRVTDEPKSPGPVALEQTVHGRVVVSWAPSPDEELDDRLHYMVAEHNSNTRMWHTLADRLYCNTYTANNIQPGREYHFRVFAKNDMGPSEPSQSPTWGMNCNKVAMATNTAVEVNFERPPSILVPLKVHAPPKGYQVYMTCAVRGCPSPSIMWYLDDVCINSDNNYYMTNAYGVCSMYILRVRPKDGGEYKVVAVNSFGKAECAAKLVVKD